MGCMGSFRVCKEILHLTSKVADSSRDDIPDYVRTYRDIGNVSVEKKKFEQEKKEEEDWEDDLSSCTVSPYTFSLSTGFCTKEQAEQQYYVLNIPKENVHLVDTVVELGRMTQHFVTSANISHA